MSCLAWIRFHGVVEHRLSGEVPRADHLHALWHALWTRGGNRGTEFGHRDPVKPFALEPLTVVGHEGQVPEQGDRVEFGAAVLGDAAVSDLEAVRNRWTGGAWTMGPIRVAGVSTDWRVPPSLPEVVGPRGLRDPATIVWRCLSPVSVRQGRGSQLPFPEPKAVFAGLWLRGHRFLDRPQDAAPADGSAEYPRVSRYRLETELSVVKGRKIIGCLGEVHFDLRHLPEDSKTRFQFLGSLAEVTGIGHGTPYGFGRVRRVDADPLFKPAGRAS